MAESPQGVNSHPTWRDCGLTLSDEMILSEFTTFQTIWSLAANLFHTGIVFAILFFQHAYFEWKQHHAQIARV